VVRGASKRRLYLMSRAGKSSHGDSQIIYRLQWLQKVSQRTSFGPASNADLYLTVSYPLEFEPSSRLFDRLVWIGV
jgi:hypothetical protein